MPKSCKLLESRHDQSYDYAIFCNRLRVKPFILLCAIAAALAFWSWRSTRRRRGPQVLPQGTLPNDARLQPLKDLDGYFPFHVPKSPEDWAWRRTGSLAVAVSARAVADALQNTAESVIHGTIDRGDYTVEKVYSKASPAFLSPAICIVPKGRAASCPECFCPHGHWNQGRFMDQGVEGVRREIVQGAERFEKAAGACSRPAAFNSPAWVVSSSTTT